MKEYFLVGVGDGKTRKANEIGIEELRKEYNFDPQSVFVDGAYEPDKCVLLCDKRGYTLVAHEACTLDTYAWKNRYILSVINSIVYGGVIESDQKSLSTNPKSKPVTGWICPVCGCGKSPYSTKCDCKNGVKK